MIGLPHAVTACLFDLDGVLTSTASLHLRAWRRTFDEVLREHAPDQDGFTDRDYTAHVDGRPRLDGVRGFLASRGLQLPEGAPDDPVDAATVHGVGNRKNDRLLTLLSSEGVRPFPGSVRYLDAARENGLAIGVVTSSANGERVLDAAGLTPYVRARVDGRTIRAEGLRGKPAPDSFLRCARELGVGPDRAAVFEDARSGVQAGRAGDFVWVVGVNRVAAAPGPDDSGTVPTGATTAGDARAEQAEALRAAGADVVVDDLGDLLPAGSLKGGA